MTENKNGPTSKRSGTHAKGGDEIIRATGKPARKMAETKDVEVILGDEATNPAVWKHAMLNVLKSYGAAWKDLFEGEVVLEDEQGKPVAVVMDYDHFVEIIEKLEDFEDAQIARGVLAAIERGEESTIPFEQLKAELRVEGLLDE